MDDNNNGKMAGFWIFYVLTATILYLCCIALKALGLIGWSWAATILSVLWIPFIALAACLLFMLIAMDYYRFKRWVLRRKRRRNTAKMLKHAMEGMTLNAIGPIYGVKRVQGEKNRSYKRRILKAARTIDAVHIPTGERTTDDRRTNTKNKGASH